MAWQPPFLNEFGRKLTQQRHARFQLGGKVIQRLQAVSRTPAPNPNATAKSAQYSATLDNPAISRRAGRDAG
ncbi:hypothetical protein M8494_27120 [Serratia ureilytica]